MDVVGIVEALLCCGRLEKVKKKSAKGGERRNERKKYGERRQRSRREKKTQDQLGEWDACDCS